MENDAGDFFTFAQAQPRTSISEQTFSCISLHKCVDQIIDGLLSKTAAPNIIANDVHPEMIVGTNKDMLTLILDSLLRTVILHGQHNTIHLSAKPIGSILLIHIRTSDTEYSQAVTDSLGKIEPLAEKLGGCVTISNNKMYGLTIAFTFINQ